MTHDLLHRIDQTLDAARWTPPEARCQVCDEPPGACNPYDHYETFPIKEDRDAP